MSARLIAATLLALCACGADAVSAEKAAPQNAAEQRPLSQLEGTLRAHPKFLFKYYIDGFGDGQACALFGDEKLKDIKVGSRILVEGHLGTRFHEGGNDKNPSPFPRTHYIYMSVESARVLAAPEPPSNPLEPRPVPPPGAPKR